MFGSNVKDLSDMNAPKYETRRSILRSAAAAVPLQGTVSQLEKNTNRSTSVK